MRLSITTALLGLVSYSPCQLAPKAALEPQGRLAEIFAGDTPKSPKELRAMQDYTQQLLKRLFQATVNLGGASGVVVQGGYVLSAAHVTRAPGRFVTMYTHDGRRIRGKTLGVNSRTDAGLIQLVDEKDRAELAFCEMGSSKGLERGQWCLMLGHPGGRKRGRNAPVRIGRIQRNTRGFVISDCPMSAGDSGGPLFDMRGRVIGINSRIMRNLSTNMHVPIDRFRRDWDRLVAKEVIGATTRTETNRSSAFLGVRFEPESYGMRLTEVVADSAAAKAGLRVGDILTKFGRTDLDQTVALPDLVSRKRPGDSVQVVLLRGDETVRLRVVLGRRQ